jgi:hypothetical protein
VYFWREASFPVWEALKADPAEVEDLIGGQWAFGQSDDGKRWMNIKLPMTSADETEWLAAYAWFGDKLALLYNSVAPKLRDEMAAATPYEMGLPG